MKTKTSSAISVVLLGLLVIVLFASPAAVQAAASHTFSGEQPPDSWNQAQTTLPAQDGNFLENLLLREQLSLSNQQNRLELSHSVAETTRVYIENQKEKGKDTTALENALQVFNQEVSKAEADNAVAASLLEKPAGFDGTGQVVDRQVALDTLRGAGQSLRQAHWTLTNATLKLRLAIQAYRNQ